MQLADLSRLPSTESPPSAGALRILHLEDAAFDAEFVAEALHLAFAGAQIELARGARSFEAALAQGGWDAILSDYRIPGFGGEEALEMARLADPGVPFIFVTGAVGDDNAAELLRRGATDFVDKARLGRLPVVLQRALRERSERDASERLALQNLMLQAELQRRVAELEATERRLLFAAQAGRLGVWAHDPHQPWLDASAEFKEHFGADPAAPFSFGQMMAAIDPRDAARVREAMDRSLENGEEYFVEHRVVRADGSIGWLQAQAAVARGWDGSALRMAGVTRDITAIVRSRARTRARLALDDMLREVSDPAEIALRAAALLGEALGAIRAGYGKVDLENETTTIDRDWTRPGVATVAGLRRFRDYGSFIDDLKRGTVVVVTDTAEDPRTRDGLTRFDAITTRALLNVPVMERGELVAILFIHSDLPRAWLPEEAELAREIAGRARMATQRLLAEAEARSLASSLEATVEQRTAALMASEEALRQSQKMEAVGQLTGGIAHDFNNLLGSISGALQLMRVRHQQGRAEDVERHIGIAQGAVKRAAALTHRLLAFSRRQTLESKPVDVTRLVGDMEDILRRAVGPAIDVRIELDVGLWGFKGDASQLENCLLNLCINARDAMPDGGRLTVRAVNRELAGPQALALDLPPGPYVEASVSDDGVGMPPEVVAKAFEPFFTTKPLGQGTGLGLSMVHGFARQSGGQARIESTPGRGTAVMLWLPRHDGAAQEDAPPDQPPLPGGQGRTCTVLLVDDESALRAVLSEALEEAGHRVVEAGDGPAALAILRAGRQVDLLVTDVGLPGGLNGRQLADAARQLIPGLPTIFITGYAEAAALGANAMDEGMRVLAKPFEIETLAAMAAEALPGGR